MTSFFLCGLTSSFKIAPDLKLLVEVFRDKNSPRGALSEHSANSRASVSVWVTHNVFEHCRKSILKWKFSIIYWQKLREDIWDLMNLQSNYYCVHHCWWNTSSLCSLGSHQSGMEGSSSVVSVFQFIFSITEWLSCSSLFCSFKTFMPSCAGVLFFFWVLELQMIPFSTSLVLHFHLY